MEDNREGDFAEDGHPEFRFEMDIEKIELPTNIGEMAQKASTDKQAEAAAAASASSLGGFNATQTSGMGGAASVVMGQFEIIRQALEASLRRVSLRVFWNEGKTEHSFEMHTFITDASKVDQSLGNLTAALGALTGASGTGTGTGTGAPGAGAGAPGAGAPIRPGPPTGGIPH
jgi:hypothetical protein